MTKQTPREVIEQLSPGDATSVLGILADSDEELAQRIVEIAMDFLSKVDPEEVGDILYSELEALEVEEAWDRAGRTLYGYVEPGEAAEEMIEEVL